MTENSTLVYVIDEFCKENNLLLKNDFLNFELECSCLFGFMDKIEYSPPDKLIRKILLESL